MMQWLKDEIARCNDRMDAAARLHNTTEYAKLSGRLGALKECLEQLQAALV